MTYDIIPFIMDFGTYLPDANQLVATGRTLRVIGGVLLHVGGILILLF